MHLLQSLTGIFHLSWRSAPLLFGACSECFPLFSVDGGIMTVSMLLHLPLEPVLHLVMVLVLVLRLVLLPLGRALPDSGDVCTNPLVMYLMGSKLFCGWSSFPLSSTLSLVSPTTPHAI